MRFLRVIAGLGFAACAGHGPTAPEPMLRITVSAESFVRGPEGAVSVPFTITNVGTTVASLPTCGASTQQLQAEQWKLYAPRFCIMIYQPLPLAPGESFRGAASVADAGRFRIFVPQPRANAASLPFDVR
ncbi:MAG: hypothetical protein NVS1B4_25000 [Gemmatimonadaceae bacterium]